MLFKTLVSSFPFFSFVEIFFRSLKICLLFEFLMMLHQFNKFVFDGTHLYRWSIVRAKMTEILALQLTGPKYRK